MAYQKITIYSTTTCPYCQMEKQYLQQKGVTFEEFLVDHDPAKAEEMIKKSGQMGVPVTVVATTNGHEEIIVGFDKPKIDQLLGISS